jgi:hypothetical protein
MNPKLLLALVALLIVIFIAGVGLGFTGDDGAIPGDMPSWVGWLEGVLVGEQRVETDDIRIANPPGCLEQWQQREIVLNQGGQCLLEVRSSSAPVRTLALQLRQGLVAEVELIPAGDRGINVEQRIEAGEDPVKLQVFPDGASLTLQCLNAGVGQQAACRIGVVE